MASGNSDWDEHAALTCFRYNTGVCAATGMTPFKAIVEVEVFQVWNKVAAACFDEVLDSPPNRLALLHHHLYSMGRESQTRAKEEYYIHFNPAKFEADDSVLLWSVKLSTAEGKKFLKPWTGLYNVNEQLEHIGYAIESEIGRRVVWAHANRLRRIGRGVTETGKPSDGVLRDSLRTFEKVPKVEWRRNPRTGREERHFRVRDSERRLSRRTPQSDLPEAVVQLFDNEREKERQNTSEVIDTEAGLAEEASASGGWV